MWQHLTLTSKRFLRSSAPQVSDITYIWANEGWVYLAAVKDMSSKEIVGYALNKRMTADLVCEALKMPSSINALLEAWLCILMQVFNIAVISTAKSFKSMALRVLWVEKVLRHSLRLALGQSSALLFLVHAMIMHRWRVSWVRSTASQEKMSWFTIRFTKLVSKPSLMLQDILRFFITDNEYKKG